MPRRFGQLTSLTTLDKFIVGKNNGLDALASLNLIGGFQIFFRNHRQNMKTEALLANLVGRKLTFLNLNWSFLNSEEPDIEAEELLECLQPPSTLKAFNIQEWKGVRFPGWGIDQIPCLLPNLVSVSLEGCRRCLYLPSFSQLPHLKILELRGLHALEVIYIRTQNPSRSVYFPALEILTLVDLPKLKGWSSNQCASIDVQIRNQQHLLPPFLPRLLKLAIHDCPMLNSFFLIPNLGSPFSEQVHKIPHHLSSLERLDITACECDELNLWDLMDCHGATQSSGTQAASQVLKSLRYLSLSGLLKLESLPEWIGNLPQLHELRIEDCPKLTALPESFHNLTSLRQLGITNCPELKRRYERQNGEDWPLIQHVPEVYFPVRIGSSQTVKHIVRRRKLQFPGFCIS